MTTPGFHDNIPEATYHADPNSLSVTGAKTLLKAPALFRHQQQHPVHKDVFDVGSAAHKLVLGVGDPIYVVPADNWTTKAAREERDLAGGEGFIPILPDQYATVSAMADKLSEHRRAMELLSDGKPEVSAYCEDPTTGVMRRGRFDWLGSNILTDYKTAVSSNPDEFRNAAARFGYHQQDAWYTDLARDLGHPADAFAFIVQEKEPPYIVTVIQLDERSQDRGRELNARALEMFRDCTTSDLWPGYLPDNDHATVSLPNWALYDSATERPF